MQDDHQFAALGCQQRCHADWGNVFNDLRSRLDWRARGCGGL